LGYADEDAVGNEDPHEDEDEQASSDGVVRGERMPVVVHVQVA